MGGIPFFRINREDRKALGDDTEHSQIVDPVRKIAGTERGSQASWPLSRAELVFEGVQMGLEQGLRQIEHWKWVKGS